MLFESQENFHMEWRKDVHFIGNKRAIFSHPVILSQTLIMYILWNVISSLKYFRKNEYGVKEKMKWASLLI